MSIVVGKEISIFYQIWNYLYLMENFCPISWTFTILGLLYLMWKVSVGIILWNAKNLGSNDYVGHSLIVSQIVQQLNYFN